jgi:hypothetical protein
VSRRSRDGRPEIFNTDQSLPAPAKAEGSQFTSDDFTGTLERHAIAISMDGKGRCRVCILSSIAQSLRTLLGRFFGTACLSR